MLRRIFGPKRDKVTGGLRKLHEEEIMICTHHQYYLGDQMRRMRWAGHVARMGREDAYTGFWLGSVKERDNLEYTGVDKKIMLRWDFRKWNVWIRTGLSWLGTDRLSGHLKIR